jgi:hypothetical protein
VEVFAPVKKNKYPLFVHFGNEVFIQGVSFWDGQVKWGMFVAGLISVGFSVIHLRLSWDHARDDLLGLLCSVLWVICLSLVLIIYRTAKQLWKQRGLPQQEERLIVLTDADADIPDVRLFHLKIAIISLSLIAVFAAVLDGVRFLRIARLSRQS